MFSTAEEVKRKFNSLRTYYNKELKKVQSSKKSGTGTGELYISGWIYYDALDAFLKHQVLPRRTLSNMVSIMHLTVINYAVVQNDKFLCLS